MIKNREQLLSHGCIEGRRLAADIIDTALREVDPYKATKKTVRYDDKDGRLRVKDDIFDLNDVENLYVVGAGKATYPIIHKDLVRPPDTGDKGGPLQL